MKQKQISTVSWGNGADDHFDRLVRIEAELGQLGFKEDYAGGGFAEDRINMILKRLYEVEATAGNEKNRRDNAEHQIRSLKAEIEKLKQPLKVEVGDLVRIVGFGQIDGGTVSYFSDSLNGPFFEVSEKVSKAGIQCVNVKSVIDLNGYNFVWTVPVRCIVEVKKSKLVIPEPTHAWEVMCKANVRVPGGPVWVCSLLAGHQGPHQAWEHHHIGGLKLSESPEPKLGETRNFGSEVYRSTGWAKPSRNGGDRRMSDGNQRAEALSALEAIPNASVAEWQTAISMAKKLRGVEALDKLKIQIRSGKDRRNRNEL